MATPISRTELQAAIADGSVTVIETLRAEHYADGHLPGALHLHLDDVDAQARALIPDQSTPIVTYCSNAACPNSHHVAARLEHLGYVDVRRYADGKQDWIEAGLPLEPVS